MKRRFFVGDALIPVDLQNAFGPNGELAVLGAEEIVKPTSKLAQEFLSLGLPVYPTADKHPKFSKHFKQYGGPWEEHAVEGTLSVEFLPGFVIDDRMEITYKGQSGLDDGYSGFDGTNLAAQLKAEGVKRIYVSGLATDYCVLKTVLNGLELGLEVIVLTDLVRAVNLHPNDGDEALQKMEKLGAILMDSKDIPFAAEERV